MRAVTAVTETSGKPNGRSLRRYLDYQRWVLRDNLERLAYRLAYRTVGGMRLGIRAQVVALCIRE